MDETVKNGYEWKETEEREKLFETKYGEGQD